MDDPTMARKRFGVFASVLALSVFAQACGGGTAAVPAASATSSSSSRGPSGASSAASRATAEPIFEARAIGPLTNVTPLQIVSVFAYDAGETLLPPATEIAGFVSDARQNHAFGKEALRSLLVTPTPATIKAAQLLVIAWGPRSELSIGVDDMAYAPIARDQGVTSLAADDVAAAFVEGALVEVLSEQKASPSQPMKLRHVTYEAGAPYIDAVSKAVSRGIAAGYASFDKPSPDP